eukprot:COSAG04_NODE_1229_length_7649_cov_3.811214_3_plen_753_part_00
MVGWRGAASLCLALAAAGFTAAADTAVVVAPRAVWRGMEHHVSVTFASAVTGSVQVSLQQGSATPITTTPLAIAGSASALLAVIVPLDAPLGDYACSATLTPSGGGDPSSTASTTVTVKAGGNQLLLETDKSIYKPGSTVQLRVLSFDAALLPRSTPITVTVTNPQDAKIQRWMDVAPTSATGEALGVVALTLPLASEPVLGEYTISAEVAGADAATATFLVDRYVLPRFGVELGLLTVDGAELTEASTLGTDARVLTGKVSAMFTFGQPVQNALVAVSLTQDDTVGGGPGLFGGVQRSSDGGSDGERSVGAATGRTNADGVFEFTIQLTHCADAYSTDPCVRHGWGSSTLKGTAEVTEDGTSETAAAESAPIAVTSQYDDSRSSIQAAISGDELMYAGEPVSFTVSATGVPDTASAAVTLEVAAEFACTQASWDRHAVPVCADGADSTTPVRGDGWEAYGWCTVTLDASHTKALTLTIDPAASGLSDCTADTLSIYARPAGSTSWSSRVELTVYRAALSLADSVLAIAEASPTTAEESLRFVVSAAWGALDAGEVHWELIVRGDILLAGTSVTDATGAQAVSVVATAPQLAMLAGGCQLAVHVFRPTSSGSMELVAQSLALSAADIEKLSGFAVGPSSPAAYSLAATFDRAEAAPGESLAVAVAVSGADALAQPEDVRSWLLAVDSSLHLLGGDSAIQPGSVEEALAVYSTAGPDLATQCNRKSAADILGTAGLALAAGSSVSLSECADPP